MTFKIPGGRDKDKSLEEATEPGIKWWLDKDETKASVSGVDE